MQKRCSHLGLCGGCSFEEISPQSKLVNIRTILRYHGIDKEIEPIFTCSPRSRRRVELTCLSQQGNFCVGMSAFHSHQIIDIAECDLVVDEILEALGQIKKLARLFAAEHKKFRINILATKVGLDVTIKDIKDISIDLRNLLLKKIDEFDFARLNLNQEILFELRRPYILFGDVPVSIPAGGFVQAVEEAEKYMSKLALDHLAGCKEICDLFAGSGSFTFPALAKMKVHAVEYDKPALEALKKAYHENSQGLKTLKTSYRDLFNTPLSAKELGCYDGIIIDPPRAGAQRQFKEIANSKIGKIAAISCNIQTLARDLALLVEAGFEINKIFPIDQFLWSSHCEIVALLTKKAAKREWRL